MSTQDAQSTARRHKARAEAALEIGRYPLAEKDARAALAAVPKDVDALLFLTRALLGQSRHDEAETAARLAIECAPTDAYAHYLLGFVLQVAGRHADAVAPLREAVRLQPRAPRFHARLAIALCESGAKDEAKTVIESVASMSVEDASLVDECARVYSALAQHERAEQFARRAVALRPTDPTTHWRLAWVLANQRAFALSAEASIAALELDPNYWAAWEELGYALFEQRSDADAEAALAEALRLKPGLRSAAFNLAALYRRHGRLARAERVCDAALTVDPRHEQLSRVRERVRADLAQQDRQRNERVALLLSMAILSVISAANARSILTLGLSAVFAVCAVVVAITAAMPPAPDDGPPPLPSLLAKRARPEERA